MYLTRGKFIMNMLRKGLFLIALVALAGNVFAITLPQCGGVIANNNGYYSFPAKKWCQSKEICPNQFDAIFAYNKEHHDEEQIRFTRLPVIRLADNTWVVANSEIQHITLENKQDVDRIKPIRNAIGFVGHNRVRVNLANIDSTMFSYLQKYHLDVYRLSDYVSRDTRSELCYMLTLNNEPNENVINEIDSLGINNRTLLEAKNNLDNQQTAWFNAHQGKNRIWFAGYASSKDDLNALLEKAKDYPRMWAIRVKENKHTKALVHQINKQDKYLSLVDSMSYTHRIINRVADIVFLEALIFPVMAAEFYYRDNMHEKRHTACEVPLTHIKSKLTVTNRPDGCLKGYSKYNYNSCLTNPNQELCILASRARPSNKVAQARPSVVKHYD